jgi:hypothetical protein
VTVLAVPTLFAALQDFFTSEGFNASLKLGRKEPFRQTNQGPGGANRIVLKPGDDSGKVGEYRAVQYPGRNPRSLKTFVEFITVYCWGYDATNPNVDSAHYEIARLLHDSLFRALYIVSRTTCKCRLEFSDPTWVEDKNEKAFGYELKFTLGVHSMIPDAEIETVIATAVPSLTMIFEKGTP